MKHLLLVTQCVLLLLSADAFAAQDAQSCETRSRQFKSKEQETFLKSCLAQISSPANVKETSQQEKRRACEQNAKNRALQGNEKTNYLNACENSNEAAAIARQVAKNTPPLAAQAAASKTSAPPAAVPHKQAAPAVKKPVRHPDSNHACAKTAQQKHLKGSARNKFISDCSKA